MGVVPTYRHQRNSRHQLVANKQMQLHLHEAVVGNEGVIFPKTAGQRISPPTKVAFLQMIDDSNLSS